MTLPRARWILCVFLVACRPQDASSETDVSARWVPVPFSPEPPGPIDDDPNFVPVSIKMPASHDAGVPGPASSVTTRPTDDPPPPLNDIDDAELATICADREASKGAFSFTPAVDAIGHDAHVSSTRDLTEHRWGDATYRTSFTLFFREACIQADASHGAMRIESLSWLDVHLDSSVSHPNAFTVGQPEAVEIGWGEGARTFVCTRDGYSTYWSDGEVLPRQSAILTLTRRDATGIAGTIDIENGTQLLTFDAPFGEAYPGAEGICCLK